VRVADAGPTLPQTASAADWTAANQAFLAAALHVVAGRLGGADVEDRVRRRDRLRSQLEPSPALDVIAAGFDLSGFEQECLLLCAGVELDSAIARACADAHGDPARPYATFGLALGTLADPHWSALSPAAPLRRWNLVTVTHPEAPTTSPARVDERVLHALAAVSYLDPRVAAHALPVPELDLPLPDGMRRAADRLTALWSADASPDPGTAARRTGPPRRVRLHGARRGDLRAVVAAAATALGGRAALLSGIDTPGTAAEREQLARLCERETVLGGWFWVLDVDDPASDAGRAALELGRRVHAPVAVLCDSPDGEDLETVPVEVAPPSPAELARAWRRAVGPSRPADAGWPDRLAGQFHVGITDVAAVLAEVAPLGTRTPTGPRLWAACLRRARPALDGLAARIDPRAGWEQLVLPPAQTALLHELTTHVRHRTTVFDTWGFGRRTQRGSGVAALFAGPSGTGKTFAGEVLARHLDLDLYRVDLSCVVSKYVGETEKNLRRIFDAAESGGAILLFDEADALFGKRSEVRDSHDRYANIEVSYLLARMETYRGLAILTTNLKDALDTAFLRRLRFIIQFPFPDTASRADIWRRVFPTELPTDGLDVAELARLEVSGGTIRNIALAAAFRAAQDGVPVRMAHVLAATRTEYAKLGKLLTEAEVAGWTS